MVMSMRNVAIEIEALETSQQYLIDAIKSKSIADDKMAVAKELLSQIDVKLKLLKKGRFEHQS